MPWLQLLTNKKTPTKSNMFEISPSEDSEGSKDEEWSYQTFRESKQLKPKLSGMSEYPSFRPTTHK